jgi:hypothetical protein
VIFDSCARREFCAWAGQGGPKPHSLRGASFSRTSLRDRFGGFLPRGSARHPWGLAQVHPLAHLTNDTDDFLGGEFKINTCDIQGRSRRALGRNEKHLPVAAFYPHRAFVPSAFEDAGELLPCFGKCIDRHDRISSVLSPKLAAAVTKASSSESRAQRC